MEVWVYRPLYGTVELVTVPHDKSAEEFAAEFCNYFTEDIYFFASLEPL